MHGKDASNDNVSVNPGLSRYNNIGELHYQDVSFQLEFCSKLPSRNWLQKRRSNWIVKLYIFEVPLPCFAITRPHDVKRCYKTRETLMGVDFPYS